MDKSPHTKKWRSQSRAKASQMLQDGAPTKEVQVLLWTIQNWEDEIREGDEE